MEIRRELFGRTREGQSVSKFYLKNAAGNYAVVTDYGCTILELWIADREQNRKNVVLGYKKLEDYLEHTDFLGACVGRFGGWILNGIISIDGQEFQLERTDGKHHLHGGQKGFDKYVWESSIEENRVCFSRISKDGEGQYPGTLNVKVFYEFTEENELKITYEAICDQDTVCNLTNHSYFNLDGEGTGNIWEHQLKIQAEYVQEDNADGISAPALFPLEGTPFDFRQFKTLGRDLDLSNRQLQYGHGYDHNFYLGDAGSYKHAVSLYSPKSGIEMQVFTNQTGVQLYTGNFLEGNPYPVNAGVCLETQYCACKKEIAQGYFYPVLRRDEVYRQETAYRFQIRQEQHRMGFYK